jgi:hypothetical protein
MSIDGYPVSAAGITVSVDMTPAEHETHQDKADE